MSDKTAPEIVPGQVDVSVPTLDVSPVVPGAVPSSQGVSEDALVEKAVARLDSLIDKRLQSMKDKRLGVLDNGGAEAIATLKEYIKAKNGDVDAAVREMSIDQLIAKQQPVQAGVAGTTPAQDTTKVMTEWTRDYLNEAGIAFDDPEYAQLVKGGATGLPDWQNKVTRLAARRAKQAVQPGAASATGASGGSVAGAGTNEDKLNRKYAELRDLQQAPPSLETRKQLKAISAEINALGGHA